jgi:hypothetical protein
MSEWGDAAKVFVKFSPNEERERERERGKKTEDSRVRISLP